MGKWHALCGFEKGAKKQKTGGDKGYIAPFKFKTERECNDDQNHKDCFVLSKDQPDPVVCKKRYKKSYDHSVILARDSGIIEVRQGERRNVLGIVINKRRAVALKAARDLEKDGIPDDWLVMLKAGWRIEPTSCKCGGKWAWLDDTDKMRGCVCHIELPVVT